MYLLPLRAEFSKKPWPHDQQVSSTCKLLFQPVGGGSCQAVTSMTGSSTFTLSSTSGYYICIMLCIFGLVWLGLAGLAGRGFFDPLCCFAFRINEARYVRFLQLMLSLTMHALMHALTATLSRVFQKAMAAWPTSVINLQIAVSASGRCLMPRSIVGSVRCV